MATKIFFLALFLLYFMKTGFCSVFDQVFEDVTSCKDVCRNTFTPHTFEKSENEDCCNRGCRLFSMMEFIYDDLNQTAEVCVDSCKEAYPKKDEFEACKLGCQNQKPFAMDSLLNESHEQTMHLFEPMMAMQRLYSNILGTVMSQASTSWSVYMKDDDGSLLVVKSSPVFVVAVPQEEATDKEHNTASYIETNIEPLDNSATPFIKNSYGVQKYDDDYLDLSARDLEGGSRLHGRDSSSSDWLSCVAQKTGIPRLLLSWLLLMCAVVMIWLCLSAAVTAPEQRVISEPQKLSINGDQEVIAELLAQGIKPTTYSEKMTEHKLGSLPIKLSVHRI